MCHTVTPPTLACYCTLKTPGPAGPAGGPRLGDTPATAVAYCVPLSVQTRPSKPGNSGCAEAKMPIATACTDTATQARPGAVMWPGTRGSGNPGSGIGATLESCDSGRPGWTAISKEPLKSADKNTTFLCCKHFQVRKRPGRVEVEILRPWNWSMPDHQVTVGEEDSEAAGRCIFFGSQFQYSLHAEKTRFDPKAAARPVWEVHARLKAKREFRRHGARGTVPQDSDAEPCVSGP